MQVGTQRELAPVRRSGFRSAARRCPEPIDPRERRPQQTRSQGGRL